MNAAGKKGSGIANKYRSKGLRVVAIDITGYSPTKSLEKWIEAGADFYLYDGEANCFKPLYNHVQAYPYNSCVKEWKNNKTYSFNEDYVKNIFNF